MIQFFKRRLLQTARYSYSGLRSAWQLEEAFRVEVCCALFLLPYALFHPSFSPVERVLLTASVWGVLIVELLNSALEKTIDRISIEQHALSKIVKDISSAAVLMSLMNFFMTWAWIAL